MLALEYNYSKHTKQAPRDLVQKIQSKDFNDFSFIF